MKQRKLLGVCVLCQKSLYTDPRTHYLTDGHQARVRTAARRQARAEVREADRMRRMAVES